MDVLQRLTGMPSLGTALGAQHHRGGLGAAAPSPLSFPPAGTLEVRKRAYLRAAVRVLCRNTAGVQGPQAAGVGRGRWRDALPPAPLADVSVRLLLKELNDIVDPPRKLPRFKVHLRRAPTQEVRVSTAGGGRGEGGGYLFAMAYHFCRVQA